VTTEAQFQHLYTQLTEVLGPEGATTMIDIVSPFARSELATKSDFAELRGEVKSDLAELKHDLAELKHDLTRTLAGWLFVSQGVMVAIVGLLVSLR